MRRHLLLSLLAVVVIGSAAVLAQTARRTSAPPPASSTVTFTETIAPIVYANCVTCHRPGEAAPFSLISYEDVAKRGHTHRARHRVAVHAAVARRHGLWRVHWRAAADRRADRHDRGLGEAGDAARRRTPNAEAAGVRWRGVAAGHSPTSCSRCPPGSTCVRPVRMSSATS